MRKTSLSVWIIVLLLILTSCSEPSKTAKPFDPNTARIGVMTGSTGEKYAQAHYDHSHLSGYDDAMDGVAALVSGRIDAFITSDITATNIARQNPSLMADMSRLLTTDPVCAGVAKNNPSLLNQINETIAQLKADGTLAEMVRVWITDFDEEEGRKRLSSIERAEGETLRVGLCATRVPFVYKDADMNFMGMSPELALHVGARLGRKIEFVDMKFGSLIASLTSGKVDAIIDLMTATEERRQAIHFSESFYTSNQIFLRQAQAPAEEKAITSMADLYREGIRIGIPSGAMSDRVARETFKNAVFNPYASLNEGYIALAADKIDAFVYDRHAMQYAALKNPAFSVLSESLSAHDIAAGIRLGNDSLVEKVNTALKTLLENGTLEALEKRWLGTDIDPVMPTVTPAENPAGVLVVGTPDDSPPMGYVDAQNAPCGYDAELAHYIAKELNMTLDHRVMSWNSLIPALQSGRIDLMLGDLNVTQERLQFMQFSTPYLVPEITAMVKTPRQQSGDTTGLRRFVEEVKTSFYTNLIFERRWTMLVSGLSYTMIISVCALLLGTLLGFALCFMSLSKSRFLSGLAKLYATLLRGMPIVVFLMILYYVVFAKADISSVFVAVIAYGLNAGAFIGEIIKTAIQTVGKCQIEAAKSMGFNKRGVFLTVTFPQAVKVALPVYYSEFISLVKSTAVVGYIAIVDLTKAGDIIRSKTYDAFFPLIAVALVYLLATGLFVWLFERIHGLLDKRSRRKKA